MRYLLTLLLSVAAFITEAQPERPASPARADSFGAGRYAGTKKILIGQSYTDSRLIKGLEGWDFRQGTMLNSPAYPEIITATLFRKGTVYLVLFSIMEDTSTHTFFIADVLEVKGVLKGWSVKTGFCRQSGVENSYITAWAKEAPEEYLKTLKKAWRFNPDKRRIESLPVKGVDCLNENFDQT